MATVKGSYPICRRDGFPMVRIDGRLQCVAEYLDRCIGQQRVVDLVQHGETTYYVFENGHELPMLCFCCGGPLVYEDLEESRRELVGRRLEAMSVGMVELEDGSEVMQFRLEFSNKGWLSPGIYTAVSPEVAAQLRHPAHCPHKRSSSTKKSRQKRGRRRSR
jgi:hypothetical protein